jgi:hypothetical protein
MNDIEKSFFFLRLFDSHEEQSEICCNTVRGGFWRIPAPLCSTFVNHVHLDVLWNLDALGT